MSSNNTSVRRNIVVYLLTLGILFSSYEDVTALAYPAGAPLGEIVGGTYRSFFDNMFPGCPTVGDVITGFSPVGVPICITPSVTGLNLPGSLGYTLYHNGTTWVSSPNIYNANGNVGIGTSTPGAKLEIAGQLKITGGSPGPGKILISDATGLASWSTLTSSFSGAYWSLTGNTITATDFIGSTNSMDLVLKANNTQRARFYAAGTVAIGGTNTINPSGGAYVIGDGNNVVGGNLAVFGYRNTAYNNWNQDGIVMGSDNMITSTDPTVMGKRNISNFHDRPIIFGQYNNTLDHDNIIVGIYNTGAGSYGNPSISIGAYNQAGGSTSTTYRGGSVAVGTNNIIENRNSVSFGRSNSIWGAGSSVFGSNITNSIDGSTMMGPNNTAKITILSGGLVGIGTTTPGAKLEIVGQIKITGGSPGVGKYLASDAAGLAIWSTVNSGDLSGALWALSGNLIGDTDYLGTNNPKSLVFKSNSLERLRITPSGSIAGLDYSSSLGGFNNLALGLDAGTAMNGLYNTALGGYGAGYQMGGTYNVALGGSYAGYQMGGLSNIALGTYAGTGMSSGNNNIYLGSYAIGNTGQDNQFSLGNVLYGSGMGTGGLTNGRIGIGTRTPGQKLTISGGTIQILYGNYGSGKVLVSDNNGVATWGDVTSGTASVVSASGIVNGVANYVPKFGPGGVGLVPGLLYDNGQTLGVGTSTPTAGYVLHASGSLLIGNDTVFPDIMNESFESAIFPPAGWSTVASGGVTITRDTTTGSSGSASVRFNGNGVNSQNASLSYTINIASNSFLSFYWKASSEPGGDILSFCLDAIPCTINISGITGWTKVTYNLSPGIHTLKWKFEKDPAFANGLDSAWLDQINIRRYGPTYLVGGHIGIGIPVPQFPLDVEGYIQSHGYCLTGLCANTWRGVIDQGTSAPGYNAFVGASSLGMLTTGIYNLAFGPFSLAQTTTGNSNTALGLSTQFANNAGSNNSSVGTYSLYSNQGSNNTTVGAESLFANVTGANNTALGYRSAQSLTSGSNNITLGYQSAQTLTTGNSNIIIGNSINLPSIASSNMLNIGNLIYATGLNGSNTTLSTGNVGIGTATPGQKLTITGGTIQIYNGNQGSGKVLMSDIDGIASWSLLDVNATASGITGGSGFYIPKFGTGGNGLVSSLLYDNGISLGLGTTSATSRFEIWSGATSYFHMRGTNNIGFGIGSVRPALTGNANSGYGHESLFTLTTGYSNSAFGYQSLRFTTSGYNNTAFGQESLYNNNNGTWNTAVGYQSIRSGGGSNYNVALGAQSLYSLNTGSGNVAIGNNALYGATTSASNNTALGYLAGNSITTGWNNITIGYNTQVASGVLSNQLNIGNWIYGNAGKISIGQPDVGSSTYMLDVRGGYINSSSGLCINDTCLSNWSNIFNAINGVGNALPKWNSTGTGLVASRILENGTDILISTGSLQPVSITPANSDQYSQVLVSSGGVLKQGLTTREKLRIFAVSNYGGSAVQSLCMYNSSNAACGSMGTPAYTNVPNYNQVDAISYTGGIGNYVPATSITKAPYFVSFYTGTYMVSTSYTFEGGSLTTLSGGCNFYPYYSVYSNTGAVPALKKYTIGTDVIFTMDFSTALSNVDSSTNLNVPDRRAKRVGMQFIQNVFMTPGQALVMTLGFQDPGDTCIGVTDRVVDLVTNSQKKQTLSIVEL